MGTVIAQQQNLGLREINLQQLTLQRLHHQVLRGIQPLEAIDQLDPSCMHSGHNSLQLTMHAHRLLHLQDPVHIRNPHL